MRRMSKLSLVCCAALAAASCGKKTIGGSTSGTVAGLGLTVKSAVFAPLSVPADLAKIGVQHVTAFVLADAADICGDAAAKALQPNQQYLLMAAAAPVSGVMGKGVYNVLDPNAVMKGDPAAIAALLRGSALVSLQRGDASCKNSLSPEQSIAVSGSVTVSEYEEKTDGTAEGSFQLSMGEAGEALGGSFTATYCPALKELLDAVLATSVETAESDASTPPCRTP